MHHTHIEQERDIVDIPLWSTQLADSANQCAFRNCRSCSTSIGTDAGVQANAHAHDISIHTPESNMKSMAADRQLC